MKTNFLKLVTSIVCLLLYGSNFAQAPNLASAVNFVLFSTNGSVSNTGNSQLTGHIGTNNGSSTAFGNVNGIMQDNNSASALCAADVLALYSQLNSATPSFFPAPLLGNSQTLTPGVYSIAGNTSLNLELTLNGQGNPNALFIFKIQGAFSANAASKIKLINSAQACNVFWKVEGLISLASGVAMRGTMLANNAAINLSTGDTLEGRALSINGAVTVDGVLAYTPTGCGSPVLSGPSAPNLGSAACFALFSTNGSVTNSGITNLTGDVGTNVGLTTGYNPSNVSGTIHPIPDGVTNACATDLLAAYNFLNALSYDIELLYPAQFGQNLVLTPHTYLLDGATTMIDTLYLNAQGNTNAVFVIQINGALSASAYAKVLLINGTQAKNVFWKIEGSVDIQNNSTFVGTIISNNGAINLSASTVLNGRALTTDGALGTSAVTVTIPSACDLATSLQDFGILQKPATIYPNPFTNSLELTITDAGQTQTDLRIYDVSGKELITLRLTENSTSINTSGLPSGLYIYKVFSNKTLSQCGKLISQQ